MGFLVSIYASNNHLRGVSGITTGWSQCENLTFCIADFRAACNSVCRLRIEVFTRGMGSKSSRNEISSVLIGVLRNCNSFGELLSQYLCVYPASSSILFSGTSLVEVGSILEQQVLE